MTEPRIVRETDPDDAFSTLANPTRVSILRALWDADDHEASFSELQAAVGVRDSGKFNYHVGRFDGRFVARTESGYRLTRAGVRLLGALVGGSYAKVGAVDPMPVDEPCPICEGALTFRYDDGVTVLDCERCGCLSRYPVPPGVLAGRDAADLPAVTTQYAHSVIQGVARGFCPNCEGEARPTLTTAATTADATDPPVALDDIPMVRSECRRCGHTVDTTLRIRLVRHPAVVSFYHDRGVDYRELSLWRLGRVDDRMRVRSRDPLRASAAYVADGDRLALTVDESLTVVDAERGPA